MSEHSPEDLEKARRAKIVIYLVMIVLISLPLFLVASEWFRD